MFNLTSIIFCKVGYILIKLGIKDMISSNYLYDIGLIVFGVLLAFTKYET